jgi:hypothetical protein
LGICALVFVFLRSARLPLLVDTTFAFYSGVFLCHYWLLFGLGYMVLLSCSFSPGKIVNQSLSLSLTLLLPQHKGVSLFQRRLLKSIWRWIWSSGGVFCAGVLLKEELCCLSCCPVWTSCSWSFFCLALSPVRRRSSYATSRRRALVFLKYFSSAFGIWRLSSIFSSLWRIDSSRILFPPDSRGFGSQAITSSSLRFFSQERGRRSSFPLLRS